jgi:hypothetical protein
MVAMIAGVVPATRANGASTIAVTAKRKLANGARRTDEYKDR